MLVEVTLTLLGEGPLPPLPPFPLPPSPPLPAPAALLSLS